MCNNSIFNFCIQASILCKVPTGLTLSSDSVDALSGLEETNMAAVVLHNPLAVWRRTYISVKLPAGLCVQVSVLHACIFITSTLLSSCVNVQQLLERQQC